MTNDEKPDSGGRKYDLEERTSRFGEAIIGFARKLPRDPVTTPLISQVVRSGTSIGANYCEADDAVSGKEFKHKIGTCKKEARETKFWLRQSPPLHRTTKLSVVSFGRKQKSCI